MAAKESRFFTETEARTLGGHKRKYGRRRSEDRRLLTQKLKSSKHPVGEDHFQGW